MKRTYYLLAAIGWFIICTWLLTLPGSNLPKEDWLGKIGADKIIHIVLFGVLTAGWCMAFRNGRKKYFVLISFLSLLYGIVMEFVQRDYIPNRGFDVWDIAADAGGSFLGLVLFLRYAKK